MPPTKPPPVPVQPWPHPFPPPIILPPEQPARFQLGPASLATLAVCLVIHLRVGLPRWQRIPLAASQDIGLFVFGFLVAIAVAWVCWRIKPRKHAGEVAFCFLLLLFAGSRALENANTNLKARVQAQQARDHQRTVTASHPPQAAPVPATPAPITNRDVRAAPLAATPPGSDPDEVKDQDRRKVAAMVAVAGNIQVKTWAYDDAVARLNAAGSGSGRGLDSLDAVARRRQLTKTALDANTAVTIVCQTAESDLLAALRGVLPEAEARETTRRALGGLEPAALLRIHDCERQGLEAVDGELALFRQEFTRWHINADGKLVFDNPAVNPWYTRYATQLRDSAGDSARLRREYAARHPAGR